MIGAAASRPSLPTRVAGHLRHDAPLVVLDAAVVFGAYFIPLVMRFGGEVPSAYWYKFWRFIAIAMIVHLLCNYLFGLYGQMWRFASVLEARRVLLAGIAALPVLLVIDLTLGEAGLSILPVSVVWLGAALSLMGFGALRFQARLFGLRRRGAVPDARRVLIVGAGEAGAMVLQDLLENPQIGIDPIAIVDDDPRKRGFALRGVRVLGTHDDIPEIVERHGIDEVLLAIPSATSELVREVVELCEGCEIPVRVLPSRHEVVGRVTWRDIRELKIEDLLGRVEVATDLEVVGAMLRGRRVLVTGAGGSIGSEIARQVAAFDVASLVLLEHDETHLHDLLIDLEDDGRVIPVLGDIRDRERVLALFEEQRPDLVFHAAAHKHVPILETHPEEAVLTNVIGTANVADAALVGGATRFVLVSTDKAVNTTNVMGASKRFAEQIAQSLSNGHCAFSAVRFGNVLGSRGSVVPTFIRQIQRGGPVTVTDPSMTRYFMSVEESVQLVLQAAALAQGGEVFTLEMGEPVNILELARRLIRLSGRAPDRDVAIEIVGSRPGEKLVEELAAADEDLGPTGHPGIRVCRPPRPAPAELRAAIRELEALSQAGDRTAELAARIKELAHPAEPSLEAAS